MDFNIYYMEKKICKNCNIEKSINEFPKTGKLCKICFNEYMRLRRGGSDKETYNKNKELKEQGLKVCKNCNIEKSINEFNNGGKLCRICYNEYIKSRYIKKEKLLKEPPIKTKKDKKLKYKIIKIKKNIKEKICKKCNILKSINNFYNKTITRISNICKECDISAAKIRNQTPEYKEYNKKYREENKDKIKKYKKTPVFKEYIKNYQKKRLVSDNNYKIRKITRNLIYTALNNYGFKKNSKTELILGCSFEEFKIYISSLFEEWMNWNNHGKYTGNYNETWQIDHIIPISNGMNEEEIIKLNHYTNLRPLCSKKNLEKSNYLDTYFIF